MRINTITCHNVYNYGASLQAYALQRFLEIQGNDVEIINYMPNYLSFHYRISTYISADEYRYKPSLKHLYVRLLFAIYRYLRSLNGLPRKRSFDSFTSQYLKLTRKYTNYKQLVSRPPVADVYIAGSDQIWNSKYMENGKDPAFYLNFIKSKPKFSFAASFGANEMDDGLKPLIKDWLSKFNAISVRESSGAEILNSLGIQSMVVCDPVFLLDIKQWMAIYRKVLSGRFLLIYNIGPINNNIVQMAKKIAKERKLTIVSIKDKYKVEGADIYIDNAGPCEFVSLIMDAEFVLSNSFHATAFSIIFSKQFYTFTFNNINSSSRMTNLLNNMHLKHRFDPSVEDPIDTINYMDVMATLSTYKQEGKDWLLSKLK